MTSRSRVISGRLSSQVRGRAGCGSTARWTKGKRELAEASPPIAVLFEAASAKGLGSGGRSILRKVEPMPCKL
jgi:hypothetical protein